MSIHSSLKVSGKLSGERNVWTRMERIQALRKERATKLVAVRKALEGPSSAHD